MHLIHIHKDHPISDIVTPTASVSSRGQLRSEQFPLRAATDETQIWSALCSLCFLCCTFVHQPPVPPSLQQLTNTDTFKRQLKLFFLNKGFLSFLVFTLYFIQ